VEAAVGYRPKQVTVYSLSLSAQHGRFADLPQDGVAMDQDQLAQLLLRAEQVLNRSENLLPPAPPTPDWTHARAFRWRKQGGRGFLGAMPRPREIRLADLRNFARQTARADHNTRPFVPGLAANNVLLSGSRGTGKSSLVKAMLS